ncbi:MAG: potassium-transporting ATPase subunit KdpC [Meiothermus sp.]|nr:potassium-transporting ATPase subunit KdpC [Meiothermus sp.]
MDTKLDTAGGNVGTWVRFALVFMVLCGLVYPVLTTLLGGVLFPAQARGSLLEQGGRVVGSGLIGQPFSSERYFIGRPSAAGYDPRAAAGSNLATSNPALRERVQADANTVAQREGIAVDQIPPDLLAASGSGLDPHISPEAARIQVARVARARGLTPQQVQRLVDAHTERGFLGNPRVNVLRLNLALDNSR